MRELEFRAWDSGRGVMLINHTFASIAATGIYVWENLIWMQYTGLKDKNKVKIFERDILDLDGDIFVVEWCDEADTDICGFTVSLKSPCYEQYQMMRDFDRGTAHGYLVIGNELENPELIPKC